MKDGEEIQLGGRPCKDCNKRGWVRPTTSCEWQKCETCHGSGELGTPGLTVLGSDGRTHRGVTMCLPAKPKPPDLRIIDE